MGSNWKTGMIEQTEEPLRLFVPPHMVQIPLEEYKRYVEAQLKGPTVEISLMEYDRLKEENQRLQSEVIQLQFERQDLMQEVNRGADVTQTIQQGIERIKREILEPVNVTESDTKNRPTPREREVL